MKPILAAFADESSKDFSGQLDALTRNGLDCLEIRNVDGINVSALSLDRARELQLLLEDRGLGVWSVGSPIGKISAEAPFAPHLELCRHTLEVAQALGAPCIRLFSFFIPRDREPEEFRQPVLERLRKMTELCLDYGVLPCHENEKGIYGDSAQRCLELLQAIPGLKAVFDPANFVQCGQDTLQAWELLGDRVHYLHIKDALSDGQVVPPGAGEGNVEAILRSFLARGGKALSLEPHLYEFVGLKGLEQPGEESLVGKMAFADAPAAFDYATNKLKGILEGIL